MRFSKGFLLGAATAAHQVEGNNTNSDFWVMENLTHSHFAEPSGDACDHYHRFREDIDYLKNAGLNAYRFSIEWARIEPEMGVFNETEIAHYAEVLDYCIACGIEPVVTLHHFSSPKWLIREGGWACEKTVEYFSRYCQYVVERLGDKMHYICTMNEVNMGLQLASIMERILKNMGISLQVGMKMELPKEQLAGLLEQAAAFGVADPRDIHPFMSQATKETDKLIMRAHAAARAAIKAVNPKLKVGVTLSLHHFDVLPGGEAYAAQEWDKEFMHYLPVIGQDDFIGIQNYTREIIGPDGSLPVPEGAETTQMGYEYYPEALEQVVRKVAESYKGKLFITENGLSTSDDTRRVEFIHRAITGVKSCMADGIPVVGYTYWSLLDNFEWQAGYAKTFGLIAVDRSTQIRKPKPSLLALGSYAPVTA